ncbi:unnamed protein product [Allacma fusca]|uniref:Uncharacterized protein n=1 Tax=Allacma fusca TaxID=39272 RepID=A0A8J2KPQ5_9HEXA|nr:unnamed protein product [Allacma fusca]
MCVHTFIHMTLRETSLFGCGAFFSASLSYQALGNFLTSKREKSYMGVNKSRDKIQGSQRWELRRETATVPRTSWE